MPGVLLIQKCAYLFQLNSTLKYFSITGGSIDADRHNSSQRPMGLFPNTNQEAPTNTGIYVTDVEFKGELASQYVQLLQNLNTQRVWGNGQTL